MEHTSIIWPCKVSSPPSQPLSPTKILPTSFFFTPFFVFHFFQTGWHDPHLLCTCFLFTLFCGDSLGRWAAAQAVPITFQCFRCLGGDWRDKGGICWGVRPVGLIDGNWSGRVPVAFPLLGPLSYTPYKHYRAHTVGLRRYSDNSVYMSLCRNL